MASPFDLQTLLRLAAGHPHLQHAVDHRSQIPSTTTTTNSPPHLYHNHNEHQAQKTFFSPSFDVLETAHEYILEGELPGLHDKKQTVVEFTDAQTVLIRGRIDREGESKKKVEGEEEEGEAEKKGVGKRDVVGGSDKVWVAERKVGEFQRNFTFPGSIDVDAVRATLEYGVLRIVVPKAAKAGPMRIQIQ